MSFQPFRLGFLLCPTSRGGGGPTAGSATGSAGERVEVLGTRWRCRDTGRRATARRVLALRDARASPILLSHHPRTSDDADGAAFTLSGHTHGGMLMLNERLGPGPVLHRYGSGLCTRAGRALVVFDGAGNSFPLRTRAPAEIVHITLERAA